MDSIIAMYQSTTTDFINEQVNKIIDDEIYPELLKLDHYSRPRFIHTVEYPCLFPPLLINLHGRYKYLFDTNIEQGDSGMYIDMVLKNDFCEKITRDVICDKEKSNGYFNVDINGDYKYLSINEAYMNLMHTIYDNTYNMLTEIYNNHEFTTLTNKIEEHLKTYWFKKLRMPITIKNNVASHQIPLYSNYCAAMNWKYGPDVTIEFNKTSTEKYEASSRQYKYSIDVGATNMFRDRVYEAHPSKKIIYPVTTSGRFHTS